MKTPVYLSRPAVTSALGNGLSTHIDALLMPSETSPLTFSDQWVKGKTFAFGAVNETLRPLPDNLSAAHRSRNNQLLWHALEQIEDDIRAAALYPEVEQKPSEHNAFCPDGNGALFRYKDRDLWCVARHDGQFVIAFPDKTRWTVSPIKEEQ